jgi:uncharacterized protein YbbC (DUF1343 family)
MKRILLYTLFILLSFGSDAFAQSKEYDYSIIPAAETFEQYLPLLKGKKVALLINKSSRVSDQTLLDTLLTYKVAEAGEKVDDEKDKETGIRMVSLYGEKKKAGKQDLKNVDVVVYDLQDVGVRFYTYISTLQYMMEACAENGKELIILDRPNPNGGYVDGPVLDTSLRSFVGMQPIPIVYGMTPGEYAKMLVGEKWFKGAESLDMKVIPCKNYSHAANYHVLYDPSPNLKSMTAIYIYPSLCLFEGTPISVGRGTKTPFQHWGHPSFKGKTGYNFRPVPVWGAKIDPPYAFQTCYGQAVAMTTDEARLLLRRSIRLVWLLRAYEWYDDKANFFTPFFDKLAGTRELRKQIAADMSEAEIKATWQPGINAFKKIRKKYLLYEDFE